MREQRKLTWIATLMLTLLLPVLSPAQNGRSRGRRGGSQISPNAPDAYKGVAVTFRGTLKNLDKKQVMIETDEDQTVSIRISRKTKFLKNGETIKPSQIDLGTHVSVDATEDTDLSILALDVIVGPPPKKTGEK
jgi:hypothetical protein